MTTRASRTTARVQAGGREADGDGAAARRCAHCGRGVEETWHTRTGYEVDHFVLHTGTSEIVTPVRAGDDERLESYERLTSVAEVVTCRQCYRLPAVRARWAGWYKTDLPLSAAS
jgi:hypothetical protein